MPETDSIVGRQSKWPVTGGFELIGLSWKAFIAKWKSLAWFLLIIPVAISLLSMGMGYYGEMWRAGGQAMPALIAIAMAVFGVLTVYLSVITGAASIYVVGHDDDARTAFKKANSIFWRYLALMILSAIIIGVGFIVFVIPGIIFGVMLAFAGTALALENIGPIQALKRSAHLVKGFWWTVFARLLVLVIFVIIISMVGNAIMSLSYWFFDMVGSGIGWMIMGIALGVVVYAIGAAVNFAMGAISVVYNYSLYRRLKEIKESDANAVDGMSMGKKFGLGVVMVVIFAIVALMFMALAAFSLVKNFTSGEQGQQAITLDADQIQALMQQAQEQGAVNIEAGQDAGSAE